MAQGPATTDYEAKGKAIRLRNDQALGEKLGVWGQGV